MERIMALDVGEKRIGIALSDAMGWTAQGLETYTRKSEDEAADVAYLIALAKEKGAKTLLFGLPRNMNGTYGPQSEKIQLFAAQFGAWTGEIAFYDERMTTMMAEQVLISADVSRKKRRQVVDKMAATVILQGYLDKLRNEKEEANDGRE